MVVLSAGGLALGLVLSGTGRAPARPSPARSTGRVPPTTGTTIPAPERSLAVQSTVLPLVDTSRDVVSGGVELAPERTLTTTVWWPMAPGRYPLVVFASGYDVGPSTYARFCSTLASAGYVVAAPSFPLEDPAQGFPLDRGDLPNEAGDVSFVISQMIGGPLAAMVDPSRVGVVGHSDGADVALEVGYEQQNPAGRPAAVVAVAPDPLTAPVASTSRPLLLVQGSADSVVPYSASQDVFSELDQDGVAVWYLTLVGADHLPPIEGGTAWTPLLDQAVTDFLDATLSGRGPGPSSLRAGLSGSSLEQLQTSGAA